MRVFPRATSPADAAVRGRPWPGHAAEFRPSARPAQRNGFQGWIPGDNTQFHLHAIPRGAELPVFLHLMMENKSSRNGAENAMKKLWILMAVLVMSISAIGCRSCPCGWGCNRPVQPAPCCVMPCETPCETPCGGACGGCPTCPWNRSAALPGGRIRRLKWPGAAAIACRGALYRPWWNAVQRFTGDSSLGTAAWLSGPSRSLLPPLRHGQAAAVSTNPSARPLSRRACRTP